MKAKYGFDLVLGLFLGLPVLSLGALYCPVWVQEILVWPLGVMAVMVMVIWVTGGEILRKASKKAGLDD